MRSSRMSNRTHGHWLSELWRGAVPALLGLLLLASCAKPLPKPPAELPPPPPPPPPVVSRPILHPKWSFRTQPNVCLATAAAGRTRLVIAVRRSQPIRLSIDLPVDSTGDAIARFHGPAGSWAAQGWHASRHEIVFNLGRDMGSLSRVLMLLSGGVLALDSPQGNLPILTLPASGTDGQQWFNCARSRVI